MPRHRESGQSSPHETPDILCFPYNRWNSFYGRQQRLMTRFASTGRVIYIEEPVTGDGPSRFELSLHDCGVTVVVPHLSASPTDQIWNVLRSLLDKVIAQQHISTKCLWFYNPMAVEWTRHLRPAVVIYDCMADWSVREDAPAEINERERELMAWADIVFTDGYGLYERKQNQHPNMHAIPSSIEASHFAEARHLRKDPPDQALIPHPRLGFCGSIDDRMDFELLGSLADMRRDWNIVFVGPLANINETDLPKRPNLHYLGSKPHEKLPFDIAGWDVAILPFKRDESTWCARETKMLEYLAAGRPVVSTAVGDLTGTYVQSGLVHVADTPAAFVEAVKTAMTENSEQRMEKVDALLSATSWARSSARMAELMDDAFRSRQIPPAPPGKYQTALAKAARVAGRSHRG
jgi:UDP-galactopyranose mutase